MATGGGLGNGWNIDPQISPDGRFVAFGSSSNNIVPNDSNGHADIFVHDRVTRVTERVSVSSEGEQANGGSANGSTSYGADITPGGRYVAFVSDASNLVPGDTNGWPDVFVHDRLTRKTERISVGTGGSQALSGGSSSPSISANGRFVAFSSAAPNLVAGDTNEATDVYVHDRQTRTTQRVSVSTTGAQGVGVTPNSVQPYISSDGRFVGFASNATNLVAEDTNGWTDIFVRDRSLSITERVTAAHDGGQANGHSHIGGISGDGRFVVFESQASNLIPGDTNGAGGSYAGTDAFMYDRQTKVTQRVSVRADGGQGDVGISDDPWISSDGRYISFQSEIPNLVPGDTNGRSDAFVYDRISGALERVSVSSEGNQTNTGNAYDAVVSGDGRYVAFSSTASTLTPGDSNGARDVFVRDRGPELGIGSMSATPINTWQGPRVTVSGWATFSGGILSQGTDPPTDGGGSAADSGAEIVGGSIAIRPESGDLLATVSLAALPDANPACGKGVECQATGLGRPGVIYGLRFSLNGARYEARSMRFAATSTPPTAGHYALYRCLETCVHVVDITGGIGTTGVDARVSIPLTALGVSQGSLTQVFAFTALGEGAAGAVTPLDEAGFPDASFVPSQVSLGIASPGIPYEQVPFTETPTLDEGSFSGSLALPPGLQRVWARACSGFGCSAMFLNVQG